MDLSYGIALSFELTALTQSKIGVMVHLASRTRSNKVANLFSSNLRANVNSCADLLVVLIVGALTSTLILSHWLAAYTREVDQKVDPHRPLGMCVKRPFENFHMCHVVVASNPGTRIGLIP